MWRADIENMPKDRPVLAMCQHDADPYYDPFAEDKGNLTLYGGHVEGLSHVSDGPNVVVWGGGWSDGWEDGGGWMPDWWFQYGSDFEIAAFPVKWMEIPA